MKYLFKDVERKTVYTLRHVFDHVRPPRLLWTLHSNLAKKKHPIVFASLPRYPSTFSSLQKINVGGSQQKMPVMEDHGSGGREGR